MPKNTNTKISDGIKRKIECKLVGVGDIMIADKYQLLSSVSGHHIVAASKGKILEVTGMRNSQEECVRGGGVAVLRFRRSFC